MKVVMIVQCVHKIGGTEKATIELANLYNRMVMMSQLLVFIKS